MVGPQLEKEVVAKVPVTKGINMSYIGAIFSKCYILLRARSPNLLMEKDRKHNSNYVSAQRSSCRKTADYFYLFVKSVLQHVTTSPDQ